jgi:hypothetical protein
VPNLLVNMPVSPAPVDTARPFSIVTTRSHPTPELLALVAKLAPEGGETRVGGAGNKVITVISGEYDAYFYPQTGTKRWDTCAPEALLRIAGGHLVDASTGLRYTYGRDVASSDPGTPDVVNAGGVLAAMRMGMRCCCWLMLMWFCFLIFVFLIFCIGGEIREKKILTFFSCFLDSIHSFVHPPRAH